MTNDNCYKKYVYMMSHLEAMEKQLKDEIVKCDQKMMNSEFASVDYITAWTERTAKITMCARITSLLNSLKD